MNTHRRALTWMLAFAAFLPAVCMFTAAVGKPATDEIAILRGPPPCMVLGHAYTLEVVVKNTGDASADYVVWLSLPQRYVYVMAIPVSFSLQPGGVESLEFSLLPVASTSRPLEITAILYRRDGSGRSTIVGQATKPLLRVEADPDPKGVSLLLVMLAIVVVVVSVLKARSRRRALTLVALFSLGLLLRGATLPNIAIYADEMTNHFWGAVVLVNHWLWPRSLMWEYPPIMQYLSALAVRFFGNNLEAMRWVSAFFNSMTVCMVYLLGESLYGRRTGLLAAVLLLLSGYNVYWGSLGRPEALAAFANVTSAYFFWAGCRGDKKAFLLSGILAGISFDTFYMGLTLLVAFTGFLLWQKSGLQRVSKKAVASFAAGFFSVTAPVLISLSMQGANPFWWQLVGRFQLKEMAIAPSGPLVELLLKGLNNYLGVLTWRAESLSWSDVFKLATLSMLVITGAYFLYFFLRRKPNGTFIFSLFAALALFVAFYGKKIQYLFFYSLPFFFLMVSELVVLAYDVLLARLRELGPPRLDKAAKDRGKALPATLAILILSSGFILVLSYSCIAVALPTVETGGDWGLLQGINYLRLHSRPGDTVATGFASSWEEPFAQKYGLNIAMIPLVRLERPWEPGQPVLSPFVLDMGTIRVVQPRFVMASRLEYEYYFGVEDKKELLENYRLVFETGETTLGQIPRPGYLVFERIPG